MRVVTVANVKGGSGKTVVAALLTLALADKGYTALAVDRDPQAGLTAMLHGDVKGLTERDFMKPSKAVRVYESAGEAILVPSTVEAYRWIIELGYPPVEDQIEALRSLLEASEADYVVIDTPPEPNPFLVSAVAVSDAVVVPVERSRASIRGGILTLYVLSLREARLDMRDKRVFMVFNKFEKRERRILEKLRGALEDFVEKRLDQRVRPTVLSTAIPRVRAIEDVSAQAFRQRRAFIQLYQRDPRVTDAAHELANELLGHLEG